MATYDALPLFSVGPLLSDSLVFGVNENGRSAGIGYRGTLDPYGQIIPNLAGAVWSGGSASFAMPIDSQSVLYELNDSGVAVGLQGFLNTATEVAIIVQNGTVIPLDGLVGQASLATDINPAGIVCGSVVSLGARDDRPFVCDSNSRTVLARINPLPGTGAAFASAINAAGDVVGKSGNRGFCRRQGTMIDLGPAGFVEDINNHGVVCGTVGAASPKNFVPGVWNATQPAPVFAPIPLPPGFIGAHAQGINDHGAIVGTAWTAQSYNGNQSAYVYQSGVSVDLNTLIPPGTGWHLQSATDINNRGQIVGYGTWYGADTGFLLSLVSPRMSDLMALIILGGVIAGGGGIIILPSGPRPVDPSGPPMWLNMSGSKRDAFVALALDDAAQSLTDMNARSSIRRAALDAARNAIDLLIRTEEAVGQLSTLTERGRLASRQLDSGKRAVEVRRHGGGDQSV